MKVLKLPMYSLLATIWRKFGGALQWWILWLFHAKFMIGVSAIIIDGSGKILLLRHRFWRVGTWGLPSGYAIRNETLEDTVRREVREETNLQVTIARLLRIKSGLKLRLEATFVGHVTGGQLKLDKNEILDAQFFDRRSLPDGLLSSHKDLIAFYATQSGQSD